MDSLLGIGVRGRLTKLKCKIPKEHNCWKKEENYIYYILFPNRASVRNLKIFRKIHAQSKVYLGAKLPNYLRNLLSNAFFLKCHYSILYSIENKWYFVYRQNQINRIEVKHPVKS